MHDVCGLSRNAFAARQIGGADRVFWIADASHRECLYPQGFAAFCDPARLTIIHTRTNLESLWCVEQTLREGVSMVVVVLSSPADLTESRRLQLAAEAGGSTGLCLIPDVTVNNAAETRWRSTPVCHASSPSSQHRWELLKNKKGTLGCWDVG